MAKWLRLWGKKRGSRMSGWWVVGSASEAAFFGALFLLGITSLTIVVSWQVFWPESTVFRIGFGFWLMVIASISFIVIGLTAFILQVSQTLASPEMRSAFAEKAKQQHKRRSEGAHGDLPKSLPSLRSITDSPGVKLRYRVASQQGESTPLIISALFATSWNTMIAILAVIAIQNILRGQPEWFLSFLLIPFTTVSYFATRWFFKLFRQQAGRGSTAVEISDLPLLPGQNYQLYLCQYGRVTFRELIIGLVCHEEVTYQQGTDVRTEKAEVRNIPIYRFPEGTEPPQEDNSSSTLKAEPEKPLEVTCQFSVPSDTMHSFSGENNAVVWKLYVKGETTKWPSFCRKFPVAVYPRAARTLLEPSPR